MANLCLIGILLVLCAPGIWAMGSATSAMLAEKPDSNPYGKPTDLRSAAETAALVIVCAAAGTYLGPKAGIGDEFLSGAAQGLWRGENLLTQLGVGALAGVVCAAGWLGAYYGWIRRRMDPDTLAISEKLQNQLGLWVRVTSGGIVEEVIFRWGLLTFLLWGLVSMSIDQTVSFWIALLLSGIVFGLAHLPAYLLEGCKPTPLLIGAAVGGNLWVTIICGFLMYRYGLIAAMVVHILFHVLWYPLQQKRVVKIS